MHRTAFACRRPAAFALVVALVLATSSAAWAAKNVILMIADGAGENAWLAASYYQARVGKQVYDRPGWQRFSCTTYPLNVHHRPHGGDVQDGAVVYDVRRAWNAARLGPGEGNFAGYQWLKATATDSAAAATALASGRKTYNSAINWSNDNRPMRGETIAEIAKAQGKSAGVVTTVQWCDATPAGLGGAHNVSRKNHVEIAREMLGCPWLDVIMGGGNPDFDNDGRPLPAGAPRDYDYVGGKATWQALTSGRTAWKLVQTKAEFEALAAGAAPPKVLGVAEVAKTLQEKRRRDTATLDGDVDQNPKTPFAEPRNANVPTLATMARSAIHCLERNPNGFFLMIEGGAVDWANHANEPERLIEEQVDFLKAVEAVVGWIESHGGWDENLLILTADHECGLVWGPDSGNVAFQPLVDRGAGRTPGLTHNAHGHANELVPLYVRGAGSDGAAAMARGTDQRAAAVWRNSGRYLDNTDVFQLMKRAVLASGSGSTPGTPSR